MDRSYINLLYNIGLKLLSFMIFLSLKILKSNFFYILNDNLLFFYSKYCEKVKNACLMGFILEKLQTLTMILITLTNFNISVDPYKFVLRKY
ncbi:hypothetical protein RM51_03880 [Chryseobacterium taiwanense]|uniref:Uncharacterized protein n=1 Tax=Chryseobacterium taiwanense TaxID=363331 RepID=A0A0B4D5A1_9FLAO|nr:hypothetical protein RM51_03880 [Chryseobacterium taiwanense]